MKIFALNYPRFLVALFSLLICFFVVSAQQKVQLAHPKDLDDKTVTIVVNYGAVACSCAQWLVSKKSNTQEYIYLEPLNKLLPNAEDIWDGKNLPLQLRLTGRFYKQKGYPQNYYQGKGTPEPAKVFRYEKIEILSRYFRNKRH
ncbi:MAG: hypothetical protein ACXVJG_20450 [Mucilaginibacter sp.]